MLARSSQSGCRSCCKEGESIPPCCTVARMNYSNVAVVVPCHNEEQTIARVVEDFQTQLPGAQIVVVDNASTDATTQVAKDSGASVISEPRPGKGRAVRRLLSDVEADCYVLVDGDSTYDASSAPTMVRLVLVDGIDMVVGRRVKDELATGAYRRGHQLGNAVLTWIFVRLFNLREITDTLSGYRVMSRRFVKSFPVASTGFEIEAELNAHAATMEVPIAEVPTRYTERPVGSESKLSTYKDGIRILRRNLNLFRDARPKLAFSILAIPWLLVSLVGIGVPLIEYVNSGLVLRFPTLIIGGISLIIALGVLSIGVVLARVTRNRTETVKLAYLAIPSAWSRNSGTVDLPNLGAHRGESPLLARQPTGS